MNKVVSEDALRRALLVANLLARERPLDSKQMRLDLASPSVHECGKLWEYAVYVTDVDYPLEFIAQLYRDRADAENAFDELKNQWGLGGWCTRSYGSTVWALALVHTARRWPPVTE